MAAQPRKWHLGAKMAKAKVTKAYMSAANHFREADNLNEVNQ